MIKKPAVSVFVSLLVLCVSLGRGSRLIQDQNSKQGQTTASPDETLILEKARELKKDNKIDDALTVLRSGMSQFPASAPILNEALRIFVAAKYYDDALQLLDERASNYPHLTQKQIRLTKLAILQPQLDALLEEGRTEKAFGCLRQMADAGYQRSHQLRHNALYEPLRKHAGFAEVMKKIADNAGLGRPPRDFTVTLTSGGAYTLSTRKGKVVLVDFWSTSCPPCVEEIPNMKAIFQANQENGFEILSISLDDSVEKLDAFLASCPMPWHTVFSGKGWKDDTAKLYEITSIPSLWLVDKEGILRYFDVRGTDLKAAVEKLLAE